MGFLSRSSSRSNPPPAYTGPRSKHLGYQNYDGVAILIAVLTLASGLTALANGIQWFTAGGSFVPHLDALETGVGAIILASSLFMMGVLFTKLKVVSPLCFTVDVRNHELLWECQVRCLLLFPLL